MDNEQKQENQENVVSRFVSISSKLAFASALIFVNVFKSIAQDRELKRIIQTINQKPNADVESKEQLFRYLIQFTSTNTVVYPLMVKECSKDKDQAYKIGLLINGNILWQQIVNKIKTHIKVDPQISLAFFSNRHIINQGNIRTLFDKYKHQDGVLYIQYFRMESFG